MFALVDCNNFYVSCERLFRPELRNEPVVVLSNNDGCVVSRSEEAKHLGVIMAGPWFKMEKNVRDKLHPFSSNYALYADMSARVMNNLARFTPNVEVYSIDECFLDLQGFDNLQQYVPHIRKTVTRNTGIPVSIGIAPSKTLAKLANKLAKQSSGTFVLDTKDKIATAVMNFPISDLWGIGWAYSKKLKEIGIETAGQLREKPLNWINKNLTIHGTRMWYELWGKSCIPLNDLMERKKAMCTSRQFGKLTDNLDQLTEAIACYTSRLAEKLRRDASYATMLSVRLFTNRFRKDLLQDFSGICIPLPHPSSNTSYLIHNAINCVRQIYNRGYKYSKVEVMATGLIPENEIQLNLFQTCNSPGQDKVSMLMDKLNLHYGRGTLFMAAEGCRKEWAMNRNYLSPSYTTKWSDIVKVQ